MTVARRPILSSILLAVALGGVGLPLLTGCGYLISAPRDIMASTRDEWEGPDDLQVRDIGGMGYYKPSALIPPGAATYRIAAIPKSYETLLDLAESQARGSMSSNSQDTFRQSASQQLTQEAMVMAQIQASLGQTSATGTAKAGYAFEVGSGEHVPGDYGAANASRFLSSNRAVNLIRVNQVTKVDKDAAVDLYFVHEVIDIQPPQGEVALEPFGKVLAVNTANGEVIGESREPVYTVTIPARHQLVAIAKNPKTGAELSKTVYASWSKEHKYYRDLAAKNRTYWANEEAALAGYEKDKAAFAKEIAEGELFEAKGKRPKNFTDLPVQSLVVMTPDDAWGAVLTTNHPMYAARPPKGDPAHAAWQGLNDWISFGVDNPEKEGWKLKPEFTTDPSWIAPAIAKMVAVRDGNGTPLSKACAALTISSFEAARLNAEAAGAQVKRAQELYPDCLKEAGFGRGGVTDFGEFYYIARHRWLTIQTTVSKVIDWRLASSKPVEIHDKR